MKSSATGAVPSFPRRVNGALLAAVSFYFPKGQLIYRSAHRPLTTSFESAQDEEHRFQVETFRNLAGICDRKAFQAGECEN